MLSKADRKRLQAAIEDDGFEYVMLWAPETGWITNRKFKSLRERYIKARTALAVYIGWNDGPIGMEPVAEGTEPMVGGTEPVVGGADNDD